MWSEKVPVKINNFSRNVIWWIFFVHLFAHTAGLYGTYLIWNGQCKLLTLVCTFFFYLIGGIGLSPASHKLFTHRAYKTTRPFFFFLLQAQTSAGIESAYSWAKYHRLHHKFQDTPLDPFDLNHGLFYVYFLRWFYKDMKPIAKEAENVFMDDFKADKALMMQHKYYPIAVTICCGVIPTLVPYLLFNEALHIAFFANMSRWLFTWTQYAVGASLIHVFGYRPHDKLFTARSSTFLNIFTLGEGHHNFHHTFPYDYRATDRYDWTSFFSWGSWIIDFFAWLNYAYDLKFASTQLIAKRSTRTGDGSRTFDSEVSEPEVWDLSKSPVSADQKEEWSWNPQAGITENTD